MSVREFAQHLGIPPRTVSKWEQAGSAREPRPHMQAMLDTALHRAGGAARSRFADALAHREDQLRGGPLRHTIDEEEDDVDRREFTKALLGVGALALPSRAGVTSILTQDHGSKVDTAHVRALRSSAEAIRQYDQHVGGGGLLHQAADWLTRAKNMLETATYTSEVGTGLMSATGDLALCAGWVAYDADRQDLARQWYSDALALATEAGDDDLAVHALQNATLLAMSPPGSGFPSRAMQLSERSHILARGIRSSRLHALIASRMAIAQAAAGDRSGFKRSITTAWREVEHAETSEPLSERALWLAFVGPAEVRYHEARGHAYLGDLDAAAAVYHAGAEEQTSLRNSTNYRAALASTLAAAGDAPGAISEGVTVLDALEGSVSSWRTLRHLEPIRSAASTHADGDEFQVRFDRLRARSQGAA